MDWKTSLDWYCSGNILEKEDVELLEKHYQQVINFQFLSDHGLISDEHMSLFQYADSASEAWDIIK